MPTEEEAPLLNFQDDMTAHQSSPSSSSSWTEWREQSQVYLASKQKHYLILVLVALDVMAILVDILVSLVTCDMGTQDEHWVDQVQEGTQICGLVFSSLFLLELIITVWAFGTE